MTCYTNITILIFHILFGKNKSLGFTPISNLSYLPSLQLGNTRRLIHLRSSSDDNVVSKRTRFWKALPRMDSLDRRILRTAIPTMINMAAVPVVNAVDTFWVGRLGMVLTLAGQAAANNAFFTLYFLVSFLPTLTAPKVAEAIVQSSNDDRHVARERVSEALFLSVLFGGLGTILLVAFPRVVLRWILPSHGAAFDYAVPYLRWRAISLVPALVSATGFAAYRGLLDTITPLRVSIVTNACNLVLDPILMYSCRMGFMGAALATSLSEGCAGIIYLFLLAKQRLIPRNLHKIFSQPPSWANLVPLLQGGASVLARQAAITLAVIAAARRAHAMDTTGVAAAAYGIVMSTYSLGIVIHVAIQSTTATWISATRAGMDMNDPEDAARSVGDRLFAWGILFGSMMGAIQYITLPFWVPVFSTLTEVQDAVRAPAVISSIIHVINGVAFPGEGVMLGLGCFRDLAVITLAGAGLLLALLSTPLGYSLEGIMVALAIFNAIQGISVLMHYLWFGPLAKKRKPKRDRKVKIEI
jgi:putative MATE family efflux protein